MKYEKVYWVIFGLVGIIGFISLMKFFTHHSIGEDILFVLAVFGIVAIFDFIIG